VTYSQEVGFAKPDPRLFRVALERARSSPIDTVHVGDSWDADYLGARGAGLHAVWLNRAGRPAPGPCTEIRTLSELGERLATLTPPDPPRP
jgi:FMN phosphatase YigB (HAD superfamily)